MSRIRVPTATANGAPSHSPPDMQYAPGISLARGLGWFSIGLGLAELLAPRVLGRITGVRHPALLQAYGVREIASGVGILTSGRPTVWLWSRVLGDAMDLATLGEAAVETRGSQRERVLTTALAVAGVTALDLITSTQMSAAAKLEG